MSDPSYPESPCIGVCALDATRAYCEGCGRTLHEIGAWSTMTVAEKRAVLDRLRDWRPPESGAGQRNQGA